MPPALRNSLSFMCFQLSFRARVHAARRLARAAVRLGRLIVEYYLSSLVPRGPLRCLENLSMAVRCTKHRLSIRCEDNARDNA